jgi:hypothetical protein
MALANSSISLSPALKVDGRQCVTAAKREHLRGVWPVRKSFLVADGVSYDAMSTRSKGESDLWSGSRLCSVLGFSIWRASRAYISKVKVFRDRRVERKRTQHFGHNDSGMTVNTLNKSWLCFLPSQRTSGCSSTLDGVARESLVVRTSATPSSERIRLDQAQQHPLTKLLRHNEQRRERRFYQ